MTLFEKIQELRDYIDEIHIRIDYDDYLNLINMVDEIDNSANSQFNCQEDLKDWLIRNWAEVDESIRHSLTKFVKGKAFEDKTINMKNLSDREALITIISENLQDGLCNVIDTYEVR